MTTRERFEEHRLSGVCSGCHNLIDPIGFGFERYDGIGQYRALENGSPIDDSGSLAMSGKPGQTFNGAVELAHKLAASRPARACYVKQWLRFAMGRQETPEDACSLRLLEDTFERSGHDIRALLLSVPTTDAFRLRAIPLAKVTP